MAAAAEINVDLRESDVVLSVFWPTALAPLLKARTSGLLLVTGAGWYAAYRICTRLLGNRFISVLVDGTQCNQLSAAERRLLYPQGPPLEEIEEEDEEETRREREEEGDTVSEFESRRSNSRAPSEFSMNRVRRSMRGARGLFSIGVRRDARAGVIRREGSRPELGSPSSSTGDDHLERGVHARVRMLSQSSSSGRGAQAETARRRAPCSSVASGASASLRIVWENNQQMWDDEFEMQEGSSRLQPAPSMGDMCSIFDDVMSVTSGFSSLQVGRGVRDQRSNTSGSIDLNGIVASRFDRPSSPCVSMQNDEEEMDDGRRIHDIPCMKDSSYMYRSVVVAGSEIGDSDAQSTSSRISNISRIRRGDADGLWSLAGPSTSADEPSSSSINLEVSTDSSRMEMSHDSGLMMMKSESSKANSSIGKRSTTMFDSAIDPDLSSDETEDRHDHCDESTPRRKLRPSMSSVSYAPSTMSLEWFDDDDDGMRNETTMRQAVQLPLERARIGSWCAPESRDLMVYTKERFNPKSGQFKALSELYSKKRLRRLGKTDSSSDLHSLLMSSIYHQVPLLRQSPDESLKRLQRCLRSYNCLRNWKIDEAFDKIERLRATTLRDAAPDRDSAADAVEGLRILLCLTVCELFDAKMAGSQHEDWLTVERPDETIDRINGGSCFDTLLWRVASEAFAVRLECFEYRNATMESTVIAPSSRDPGAIRTLPYLRPASLGGEVNIDNSIRMIPLYLVPDD